MTQSRLGSEYDDPDENAFMPSAPSAVCRQCQRGDHDDCALITWAAGTCQCQTCNLVEAHDGR